MIKKRINLSVALLAVLLVGLSFYVVKSRNAQPLEPCVRACVYLLRIFDTSSENAYHLFVNAIFDEIKTTIPLSEGYPQVGGTGTVSGDKYLHCIPGLARQHINCILLNDQNNFVLFFFHVGPTANPVEHTIYILPPWPWINARHLDPSGRMMISIAAKPVEFRQKVDAVVQRALEKLGVVRYTLEPDR